MIASPKQSAGNGWSWMLLLLLGSIAFGLSIYTVFLNQLSWNSSTLADKNYLIRLQTIENLTFKDMDLMEEDASLVNDIETFNQQLLQAILQRTQKDTQLLNNFTDLENRIVQDELDRIEKDAILQENATYIQMMIDMLVDFDVFAAEQFMLQCGNITQLNMDLDDEITQQQEKDAILLNNVSDLFANLEMLENTFISTQSSINSDLDGIDTIIAAFSEKQMILMGNISDLETRITAGVEERENTNSLLQFQITQIQGTHMLIMDLVSAIEAALGVIIGNLGTSIVTINGEESDAFGNIVFDNPVNAFGNQITLTPTANGIDVGFDFYTGLEPRIILSFFHGSNAIPSSTYVTPVQNGAFFSMQIYPPPGTTSLLDPLAGSASRCEIDFSPKPCATGLVQINADDLTAGVVENPLGQTGAVRLVGRGGYDVQVTMNLGSNKAESDKQYTMYEMVWDLQDSGDPASNSWEVCSADHYPTDNTPRYTCQYTDRGEWTEGNYYSGPRPSSGIHAISGSPALVDGQGTQDQVKFGSNYYLARTNHLATAANGPGSAMGSTFWSNIGTDSEAFAPQLPDDPEPETPCFLGAFEDIRPFTLTCRRFIYLDDTTDQQWLFFAYRGYSNLEGNAPDTGSVIRTGYVEFRVEAVKVF